MVGVIGGIDKTSPGIVQAFSCSQRDVIYLLHENGSVSMRARRRLYNPVQTPSTLMSKSFSQLSVSQMAKTPTTADTSLESSSFFQDPNLFEIVYEQKAIREVSNKNDNF